MSHSRKNLKAKALNEEIILTEEQKFGRVLELRGSNICEIEYTNGEKLLCQIPQKFRKLIWIKRGNIVIVREPSNWNHQERKIRALVEHILFPNQIKYLKRENKWPPEFNDVQVLDEPQVVSENKQKSDDQTDDEEDLFVNPNHQVINESESEDSEEEG